MGSLWIKFLRERTSSGEMFQLHLTKREMKGIVRETVIVDVIMTEDMIQGRDESMTDVMNLIEIVDMNQIVIVGMNQIVIVGMN